MIDTHSTYFFPAIYYIHVEHSYTILFYPTFTICKLYN